MPSRELHEMLVKLDAELRNTGSIAGEDRELLEQVKGDLEALLSNAPDAPAEPADAGLRDRLDHGIERFEADYPSLANMMRMALDALNKLGI